MNRRMKRARLAAPLAIIPAVLAGLASPAHATITATAGQTVKIAAPPSVAPGALESNTQIFAFDERQSVTLKSPLAVDVTQPGRVHSDSDLTPGTIPAGTRVSSHFLHADPVGSPAPQGSPVWNGTATFDNTIVGIVVLDSTLDNSDGLGAVGTIYPTGYATRGLEFNGTVYDFVLSNDMKTITVGFAAHLLDEVRVITAAPPAPGGGGRTPGFWSNRNGFATMNDGGTVAPELAMLNALHLVDASGSPADFATYDAFRTWLLNGSATNMAYKLSNHVAAMRLNVEAGFVDAGALVYAPGTNSADSSGVASIAALLDEAEATLTAHPYTPTGSPDRAYQEAIKNALDAANNNTNWAS